jgi:hypothetical protein
MIYKRPSKQGFQGPGCGGKFGSNGWSHGILVLQSIHGNVSRTSRVLGSSRQVVIREWDFVRWRQGRRLCRCWPSKAAQAASMLLKETTVAGDGDGDTVRMAKVYFPTGRDKVLQCQGPFNQWAVRLLV